MKPHHHTRQVHQGTHTHAKRQPQGRVVHGRGVENQVPDPAPGFRQPAGCTARRTPILPRVAPWRVVTDTETSMLPEVFQKRHVRSKIR